MKNFKLGETVYTIDKENLCIYKDDILALGEDFFIPIDFDCRVWGWKMIDFDITFHSFEEAKKELRKYYLELRKNKKCEVLKLVQITNDFWAYQEKGEIDNEEI